MKNWKDKSKMSLISYSLFNARFWSNDKESLVSGQPIKKGSKFAQESLLS